MTKVTSGVVDGPRPITCDIFVSPVLTRADLLNGPGLTPLRSAHAREEGHLFIYGPFYATLNIGPMSRRMLKKGGAALLALSR
jgi:hypothetical protein